MMKTVAIITCSNAANYGARLQCYALSRHLSDQGHKVAVIDYRPPYLDSKPRLWYRPGASVKQWAKLLLRFRCRQQEIQRIANFQKFSQNHIPLTKKIYHSIDELRADPPTADIYIAGSDQIWNPIFPNGYDPAFFLDFGAPEAQRISYAASFGVDSIDDKAADFIRKQLLRFQRISVREKSGVKIVESLGLSAQQDCDPVMLLSPQQWEEIIPTQKCPEDYLLVYDQMGSKEIGACAKEIAQREGLKIYSIGTRRFGYADRNFLTDGPEWWLWLVRNARMVVTNSYHGCVFAHLFDKPFTFVPRPDGLNSRITEWLEENQG